MSNFVYRIAISVATGSQMIVRSDNLWIPTDLANTDYQKYLEWVEEGNVAEEWTGE